MEDKIKVFHGSENIIENPELKKGKVNNDYGRGFYLSDDSEKGKEWACKNGKDGFLNEYLLDLSNLKVLNLLDEKYSILNWIAILLKNRHFDIDSEFSIASKEYLLENFLIDTTDYDVVIGYRADDSYFSFANGFISNTLSLNGLNKALRLGYLGTQIVLISDKAINNLFFEKAEKVYKSIYYPKYCIRDEKARKEYLNSIKNINTAIDELYMLDIMRGKIKNEDPRIQRIISK